MRRVVIVVPSLFTLFNLFFGIWSMVLASRGEFYRAGWYIFFAGVLDALDGRVARLARTPSPPRADADRPAPANRPTASTVPMSLRRHPSCQLAISSRVACS